MSTSSHPGTVLEVSPKTEKRSSVELSGNSSLFDQVVRVAKTAGYTSGKSVRKYPLKLDEEF
jgi:hypothetical protein